MGARMGKTGARVGARPPPPPPPLKKLFCYLVAFSLLVFHVDAFFVTFFFL